MIKKIWYSLPFNKRKLSFNDDEGKELQGVAHLNPHRDAAGGGYCNSDSMENDSGTTDDDSPVFLAIQQFDIDELTRLLDESPDMVNETRRGGQAPLHTACYLKNLQILQVLLNRGALPNKLDGVGSTALYIALYKNWHEGVAELLQKGASPDIKCQPLETGGEVLQETPLHFAVRRRDLTSALLMLKRNPDLTRSDSEGCTILHLAAQSLNVQILKHLLEEKQCQELLTAVDCKGNSIMHAALVKTRTANDVTSLQEILRALFEAGVDVNSMNLINESPIYCAAQAGLDKAVEFLISLGADLRTLTRKGQSLLHGACVNGSASCLRRLLNTRSLHDYVTRSDDDGKEPFYYAVLSGSIDCCELLLNNGDHLTRIDKSGTSHCSLIIDYLPSAKDLLEHLFGKYITLSDKPQHDPEFRITFDYSILLSPSQDQHSSFQSSLIADLSNNDQTKSLLKHPLVESFLFRKWSKIRYFFYANVFIFFLFLLVHSIYIVSVFKKDPIHFSKNLFSEWVFRFLHILMYLLILIPEIIITISHPKRHLKHWESLTKLISLVLSAFVIFSQGKVVVKVDSNESNSSNINITANDETNTSVAEINFQRQMAAMSAFFGWVELMMLCGRFPALGAYALMFTRIAKSMVLFIMAFITLLIGFAICFMVLFYDNDVFGTFWPSIVKTLMMMVGEIDYEGLTDDNPPVLSYVMLVAFLFLVSILVVNLMIGLAVNDISNLEILGKIERLSKQASCFVSLERLIAFWKKGDIFPQPLIDFLSATLDVKSKTNISLNKRRLKRNWKCKIPAEIIEGALVVGMSREDSFLKSNYETAEAKMTGDNDEITQKKIAKILRILEAPHQSIVKYRKHSYLV